MAHFFGNYAATIKQRQEMMHTHLRRVEVEINKLTDQIRERFSEMKKFELALAAFEKRQKQAADKRAQQEMDEVAIRGYIRRDEA
jgi:septal ring factor EnvC (AmiA/AmiB activator)